MFTSHSVNARCIDFGWLKSEYNSNIRRCSYRLVASKGHCQEDCTLCIWHMIRTSFDSWEPSTLPSSIFKHCDWILTHASWTSAYSPMCYTLEKKDYKFRIRKFCIFTTPRIAFWKKKILAKLFHGTSSSALVGNSLAAPIFYAVTEILSEKALENAKSVTLLVNPFGNKYLELCITS